jgi:hypothetical protein
VQLRHCLSGTSYTHLEKDRVLVEDASGVSGVFDNFGRWLSGERRTADPEMCSWVADAFVLAPAPAEETPSEVAR